MTAATLIAGVLMSIAVFFALQTWEKNRAVFEFTLAAEEIAVSIQRSTDRNLDAVRALTWLYSASDDVQRDEFQVFAKPLLANNPSLYGVGWIPRIAHADRAAFEAQARVEFPEFRIIKRVEPDQRIPADEHPEYFPVWYMEPLVGNGFGLGFDISFSPIRLEAAWRARDTGMPSASGHFHLPADITGHNPAEVIFSPIYSKGASVDTLDARRTHLKGFVVGVFRVGDTVDASLHYVNNQRVDVHVYENLPDGTQELLYYRPANVPRELAEAEPWHEPPPEDAPQLRRAFSIAGHSWLLILTPAATTAASSLTPWLPWGGLVGGLLFTGLLAAYLGTLIAYSLRTGKLVKALKDEVAERRRAELEARHNRDFLSTVLDTAGALVMVLDPHGGVVGFNRTCETLTGYTLDEVKGRRWWDFLLIPEDVEPTKIAFHRLVEEGTDCEREQYWVAKDGSRHWVAWTSRILRNAQGSVEYVIATGLDRTDRRRAEEAEKAAEMAHVMRLSALGELGSGLAHEINQPLGAIVNYAQGSIRRLQAAPTAPPGLAGALQEIISEAMRASRIIQHLRQLVRKETCEQTPTDLNAAVNGLMRLVHGEALRQGVTVELRLHDALPPVLANQVQIEQVLLNLIRNGIEAMMENPPGERTLAVCTRPFDDGAVEVVVCDIGPGVPAVIQDKLFQPFQTTKPEGMGMGLSISWSIIQAHHGQLWVAASPERGTCFHFTLPIAVPAETLNN